MPRKSKTRAKKKAQKLVGSFAPFGVTSTKSSKGTNIFAKRGRKPGPKVKPHKSQGRKPCPWCGVPHSKAKHRSHGEGSFARTHGGG